MGGAERAVSAALDTEWRALTPDKLLPRGAAGACVVEALGFLRGSGRHQLAG
jgi:hypothetical protein